MVVTLRVVKTIYRLFAKPLIFRNACINLGFVYVYSKVLEMTRILSRLECVSSNWKEGYIFFFIGKCLFLDNTARMYKNGKFIFVTNLNLTALFINLFLNFSDKKSLTDNSPKTSRLIFSKNITKSILECRLLQICLALIGYVKGGF